MIDRGWITRDDLIAYIGGAFGEGGGSTFLEIDPVRKSSAIVTTVTYSRT